MGHALALRRVDRPRRRRPHDVTTQLNAPKFFGRLAGSGFSFEKVQAKGIAANRGASPAETLANFKSQLDSTGRPPGPIETILGETLVHAEDIRRPLGLQHNYPTDAVVRVFGEVYGLGPEPHLIFKGE